MERSFASPSQRAAAGRPSPSTALYDLGVQLARDGQTADPRRYLDRFAHTAPLAEYARRIQQFNALLAQLR
jgi:hypothetical protein